MDSINLSTNENELEWDTTLNYMIDKSEDGSVILPMTIHESLEKHMAFISGKFIHIN